MFGRSDCSGFLALRFIPATPNCSGVRSRSLDVDLTSSLAGLADVVAGSEEPRHPSSALALVAVAGLGLVGHFDHLDLFDNVAALKYNKQANKSIPYCLKFLF